MIEIFLSS